MEHILCSGHDKPCFLKTGVKDGPSYGKSFYICSNSVDRCSFVQDARNISLRSCPDHPDYKIELQALNYSKSSHEKRQHYRCALARSEKKPWCGQKTINIQNNSHENNHSQPLKSLDDNVEQRQQAGMKQRAHKPEHLNDDTRQTESDQTRRKSAEKVHTSKTSHRNSSEKQGTNMAQTVTTTAPTSLAEEPKIHPKNRHVDKLKKDTGLHNESFESLAAKVKSRILSDEGGCNTTLNDSHMSYRNTSVAQADSDSSDDSVYEDSMQELVTENAQPSAEDMSYRDNSVVAISSDDSEDEDHEPVKPVAKEPVKPLSKEPAEPTSNEKETTAKTSGTDQIQTLLQKGALDSNPQLKASVTSALNSGAKVELVSRPDGSKVIKIIKPSSEAQPSAAPKPSDVQVLSDGPSSAVTNTAQGQSLLADSTTSNDLLKHVKQKNDLIRLLNHQKSVTQKMNLAALPDKGAKLQAQITSLTHQVSQLEIKINHCQQQIQTQGGAGAKPKVVVVPSSQLQRNAAGQLLPSGVKQTKITDHGVTNLPAHVFQQMYAANPQMNTMYGGRMTESRLREVGSVTSEAIERLHKQLDKMPDPEMELEDPEGLIVPLMQHQRQALTWLTWREKQHPPGGILADDMGLGKTLTMISLVLMQKLAKEDKPDQTKDAEKKWLSKSGSDLMKSSATLIICPASLVHQWHREISRRCESDLFNVILYHGPNREKDLIKLAKADIVLTTYNLISREVGVPEDMKKNKHKQDMAVRDQEPAAGEPLPGLLTIAWERIILDEAHSIKNHKSLTAMSVSRLRALYRWALTGTPIQNDLLDMYSLLRFLRCSPFDEYKLWKRQVDNKSAKGTQRLNMLVKTLLLRRTKDQTTKAGKRLVSLPDRSTMTHEMALKPEEKAIYERIFEQSKATLQNYLKRHEDKEQEKRGGTTSTNPWAKEDKLLGAANHSQGFVPASQAATGPVDHKPQQPGGGQILLLLLRLRQCCSHLSLMKDALDVEELQTDGLELDVVEQMQDLALKESAVPKEPDVKKSNVFDIDSASTKIEALVEEIQKIKKDSDKKKPMKSVVVSQWTKMLEVVEYHLKNVGVRCCTIKGNVPPKTRAEMVDTFNDDPKGPTVMLVSLRAGGVGLNLIGGNHLFLIDMHWNPALEQQACDRVYRVGQKRDVFIHRFICKGTVEEKILALQQKKLTLAKDVLSGAGAASNKLTLADLRMLFDLDRPVAMPANFHGNQVIQTTQFNRT